MKEDKLKLFEIGSFVYVHFDYGTLIGKLVSCDIIRKDQEDTKVTFAVEFDHGRVCTDIPEERVERWIPPVNKMRDATKEEQESVSTYVKSISKPTGVNFYDLLEGDNMHTLEIEECQDIEKLRALCLEQKSRLFSVSQSLVDASKMHIEPGIALSNIRSLLSDYDNKFHYTLTIIFNKDASAVLMVFHNKQKKYNYIGGKIEPGENPYDASYRELEEETGITRDQVDLKFVEYEYTEYMPAPEWHLYITAGILKEDIKLKSEKNQLFWVSFAELNKFVDSNISFGDGNCLVYLRRAQMILSEYYKIIM